MENDLEKAILLCKELAKILDDRCKPGSDYDRSYCLDKECIDAVDSTAEALSKMSLEVFLRATKAELQLERMVKYHLDEHPLFNKILNIIDKICKDAGLKSGTTFEKYIEVIKEYEK